MLYNDISFILIGISSISQMHTNQTNNPPPISLLLPSPSCVSVNYCKDWPLSCCYTIWFPQQLTLVKSTDACQPCHHCPLCMSQHSPNTLPLGDIRYVLLFHTEVQYISGHDVKKKKSNYPLYLYTLYLILVILSNLVPKMHNLHVSTIICL